MNKTVIKILGVLGILLLIMGICIQVMGVPPIAIIGGADGPTSIFIAGKVDNHFSLLGIVIGIVLIAVTAILSIKRK